MERLKTRNEYVGCNGKARYYADERVATSYDHWKFVNDINGKTVFNTYRYSATTAKHQNEVEYLMESLGHKIDLYVNMEDSLDEYSFKKEALYSVYEEAVKLIVRCNTPRVRAATIEGYRERISYLKDKIKTLGAMGAEFSMKRIVRFYRLYNKEMRTKEKALNIFKTGKNKTFVDKSNKRCLLIGKNISREEFILKPLDGKYKTTASWYYFLNQYKECPLSSALNGV